MKNVPLSGETITISAADPLNLAGVLVPASPRGEGDTAGVEWYDSGIGFAIPMADVAAAVPRLKDGKDGGLAGSLRGAELGLLAEAGKSFPAEIAHPFYWAPFALIGEGGQRAGRSAAVSRGLPSLL